MLRKVLIANRGEIAVRIVRALREMDLKSVAVYSDADRASLHVQLADEAAHIGGSAASDSYLSAAKIIGAAKRHGADAIHPGYGFLSENADFAEACSAAGVCFIGPSPASIRAMGSKTNARAIALAAGTPVVPGGGVAEARSLGFPLLVKAAAGGGGKGMRAVRRKEDLTDALRDAASEAENAFGDSEVYLERLIEDARHIEIQVLADSNGHIIHLGERECSVQRRHQKVIEECPSPFLAAHPGLRERMGEAAIRAARGAGYENAGTVEFLVEQSGEFYFLEMNTRLQVEHPITELVTGADIVRWQIRIAAGERLSVAQDDIRWRGHAIECRIYAEDPMDQFLPSPGTITNYDPPSGPGIRIDSGVYSGWTIPVEYDPLLAKLAAWAEDRPSAIARLRGALAETHVGGVRTNLDLFHGVLQDPQFQAGEIHTGFLEEFMLTWKEIPASPGEMLAAVLAAVSRSAGGKKRFAKGPVSDWQRDGRSGQLR